MKFLTDFADQAVILPLVFAIAAALAIQGWIRGAVVWLSVIFVTFGTILVLKLFFLAACRIGGTRSDDGWLACGYVELCAIQS